MSATLAALIQLLAMLASPAAMSNPVSANWVYKISIAKGAPTPDMASKAIATAGMLLGAVTVADGSDVGTMDAKGFSLRSHIKVATLLSMLDSNLNMERQSNGIFVNNIAFTQRYSDKRGSNPELLMVTNLSQKQIAFSKGPGTARTEPMKYATVDIAMLPYAFIGRPAPKTIAFVAFSDGKSIYTTGLTSRPEKIEVAGQTLAAVRLSGTASGGTLDLWVREADGYPLQMRVGLNAQYGAVLDQQVEAVPKALFVR